jgi:hypothetical protein
MPDRLLAIRVARELIDKGERPHYRIGVAGDPPVVVVVQMPWLTAIPARGADVLDVGRAIIAAELGRPPASFDVELE